MVVADVPAAVEIEQLQKNYQVPVRNAGVAAALRSLVYRETREVEAVKPISFRIEPGEVVGFLGPNGAGKTTTIKMLTGLLHPSGGLVKVAGFVPGDRHSDFLRKITLVMGQRNQMLWDIPVIDSFERNRVIYNLQKNRFDEILAMLTDWLELADLLNKPVRNLSLGERMKCEVALALLHEPQILFLDEPTIGLDVTMQRKLREFLAAYNKQTGATILLTSHYMADVEALCERVIVIHHGQILFDGKLASLVEQFTAHKTVTVKLTTPAENLERFGAIVNQSDNEVTFRLSKSDAPNVTSRLLLELDVADLSVEDPPIEEVIEAVFSQDA